MKRLNTLAIAAAAFLLCSCIPSVNPFYTQKDIAFDTGLLGEWRQVEADKTEEWKFEKDEDDAYKLVVKDKEGKTGEFKAHLFKLKQERFLDLIPSDCSFATNQADLVGFSVFPGHLVFRVNQLGPQLSLAAMNYDWLEKHLKAYPKALAHRRHDNGILLTADTRSLQRFILAHLHEGELFGDPGEMDHK